MKYVEIIRKNSCNFEDWNPRKEENIEVIETSEPINYLRKNYIYDSKIVPCEYEIYKNPQGFNTLKEANYYNDTVTHIYLVPLNIYNAIQKN